jgi:hypothetical protein
MRREVSLQQLLNLMVLVKTKWAGIERDLSLGWWLVSVDFISFCMFFIAHLSFWLLLSSGSLFRPVFIAVFWNELPNLSTKMAV